MIKKITTGYAGILKQWKYNAINAFKFILFLAIIFGLSVAIVYPLWAFATNSPEIYTKSVIILSLAIIISFTIYRIVSSENTLGKFIKVIYFIIMFILVLFLIFLFTRTVLGGIITLLTMLFIYGLIRFGIKK